MKLFKKRTLALVLASVVTVVGSFASEKYENSLMNIALEPRSGGLEVVVETKDVYFGSVTPVKMDSTTYSIVLPKFDSVASVPNIENLSNVVQSVNIRTMPFSQTGEGFTRIIVKTLGPINISASTRLFVEGASQQYIPDSQHEEVYEEHNEESYSEPEVENDSYETANTDYEETKEPEIVENSDDSEVLDNNEPRKTLNKEEKLFLILGILIVIIGSIFFYGNAKRKLQEVIGENLDIGVDEEDSSKSKKDKTKEEKLKKIRKTIKTLDKTYSKTNSMPDRLGRNSFAQEEPIQAKIENVDVIDMDELLEKNKSEQQNQSEDEENLALEEFLQAFTAHDEEIEETTVEENVESEEYYDEEYYNKLLNSDSIKFNQDDIDCINLLLNTEIMDSTIRNIEEFAVSNPIKTEPDKQKILEDLVTSYTISHNITFTKDDVEALYKLINVEIDNDFVTNLKTNPIRTKKVEKELKKQQSPKPKVEKVVTLDVKKSLPDLSLELKKQGAKKAETKTNTAVIDYSENSEVGVLKLDIALPNLEEELKTAKIQTRNVEPQVYYADKKYDVEELKIASELPDLQDALANPDKYADPEPEPIVVDEEALLKNITNVQFKMFDDGTRDFEVLNDFTDSPVSDFEIPDYTFEQKFMMDQEPLLEEQVVESIEPEIVDEIAVIAEEEQKSKRKNISSSLLEKIKAKREQKQVKKQEIKTEEKIQALDKDSTINDTQCIIDNDAYTVVSTTKIEENTGCHLAKNDNGYIVIGYIGNQLFKIKQFESLKGEKIQARKSEVLDDGTVRYIVRISVNKFIIDIKDETIKFVMDL